MLKQTTLFRLICTLCLFALAGFLTACGDDDSTTGGETTTVTTQPKKDFIKAADVICIRENGKIRAQALEYQEKNGVPDDPKKQQELIETIIIPAQQRQVDGLTALDPPKENQKEAEDFIALFEEVVSKTEDNPPLVLQQTGPYQDLREAGQAFGFKACGQ